MVKKKFILSLVFLFVLGFISAGFTIGNHSIQKSYASEGTILGWVEMNFSQESLNSVFTSSFGNSITLKELLDKNSGYIYSCSSGNCESGYSFGAGGSSLNLDLDAEESKLMGFKLTGKIDQINSLEFNVQSDAISSCENQLKIDLFDEDLIYFGNNKSSTEICSSANYGCFNSNLNTELLFVGTTPYCQKINLTESPGFELGTWIKEETAGNKKIKMTLYDSYGSKVSECSLSGINSLGGEVACGINYSVQKSGEHYVCVSSDSGTGNYQIKGASVSNGCGFNNLPLQTYMPASYQIFAKGKKFANFGDIKITNSFHSDGINNLIEDYLLDKYGSMDCSNNCLIPIEIISSQNQRVTLSNLKLNYKKETGTVDETQFYELIKAPAKVNSNSQKLYLDNAGFSAPSSYGNSTFILKLNNENIFSEIISVDTSLPTINGISPFITAAAFPTKFRVNVNSTSNITKYEWVFDDEKKITTTNQITHSFNSIGTHTLKVTVTNSKLQNSSKMFEIEIVSPKEAINKTLESNLENLEEIKTQINSFSGFYKDSINQLLNISEAEIILNEIKTDYENAVTDEEYIVIMENLAEIRIPKSIIKSANANSISFYPEENAIDLDVLKLIGGGNYSAESSKYVNAIFGWQQENVDVKIDYNKFSANYEEGQETLLNFFKIKINEKKNLGYDYYLILGLSDVNFETIYNTKQESGYYYLTSAREISFSTPEEFDFTNLPAFVSPGINRLVISDVGEIVNPDSDGSRWGLFIAIIIGLIILGLAVYIVLQQWYKNKYEKYLFKDRNNLFNLINYINASKEKGFSEEQINESLKKAGWNSEQREYALKKYAGRRTGMFEIPITTFIEKLKNKKGQESPQGKIPSTRSI